MPPLVSIIVPAKNRLNLLSEAIESIRNQTYPEWEAVVVDDNSQDGTWKWLEAQAWQDARIRGLRRVEISPDVAGAPVCRNVGWSTAKGDYLLFLDCDDALGPECLAGRVAALEKNRNWDFVVGQCEHFKERPGDCPGQLWSNWEEGQNDLDAFLGIGRIPWQTAGPLWRKKALAQTGPWDVEIRRGQDYEYHVRALCAGLRHGKISRVDYYWRDPREDSLSAFAASKKYHAHGDFITTYNKVLGSVTRFHQWNEQRRIAQRREAVQLSVRCRLFGGGKEVAQRAIRAACSHGLLSRLEQMEINLAVGLWFPIGGIIFSMAYLNRRYALTSAIAA